MVWKGGMYSENRNQFEKIEKGEWGGGIRTGDFDDLLLLTTLSARVIPRTARIEKERDRERK